VSQVTGAALVLNTGSFILVRAFGSQMNSNRSLKRFLANPVADGSGVCDSGPHWKCDLTHNATVENRAHDKLASCGSAGSFSEVEEMPM
jgi:hypothetical protein